MRVLDKQVGEGVTTTVVGPDHAEWPRYEIRATRKLVEVHRQMVAGSTVYGPGGVSHALLPFVLEAVSDLRPRSGVVPSGPFVGGSVSQEYPALYEWVLAAMLRGELGFYYSYQHPGWVGPFGPGWVSTHYREQVEIGALLPSEAAFRDGELQDPVTEAVIDVADYHREHRVRAYRQPAPEHGGIE